MWNLDHDKFEQGLKLRFELAKCAVRGLPLGEQFKLSKDSISRDYHTEFSDYDTPRKRNSTQDVQIARIVLEELTLEHQRRVYNELSEFTSTVYLPHLILGRLYDPRDPLDPQSIASSMDLSLFVQYLLFSRKLDINPRIVSSLSAYFSSVNLLVLRRRRPTLKDMISNLGSEGLPTFTGIEEFQSKIRMLKASWWYVFGVDPLNILHGLVSANDAHPVELEETSLKMIELMGWDSIIGTLIKSWTRSTLYHSYSSCSQVAHSFPEAVVSISSSAERLFNNRTQQPPASWRGFSEVYLSLSGEIIAKAEEALESGAVSRGMRWLVTLSKLDTAHFELLDWGRLNRLIPPDCGVFNFARAYIELQFIEVATVVCPEAANSRGIGTFTGVLLELLERMRNEGKQVPQILQEIKRSLPPQASGQLVEKLLSRDMLERTSSKLPIELEKAKSQDLIPKISEEDRLMALRVSMASEAERIGLISSALKSRIHRDEKKAFAVRKFKREFARGRIRIPWRHTKHSVADFVRQLNEYLSTDHYELNFKTSSAFVRAVINFLADHLVDSILFQGASSVDYILGANLRHGVIVTTYMAAFSKALSEAIDSDEYSNQWDLASLKNEIGEAAYVLDRARSDVLEELKRYVGYWLTINDHGELHSRLKSNIQKACLETAEKGAQSGPHFEEALLQIVQQTIQDFIARGRIEFNRVVSQRIKEIVAGARSEMQSQSGVPTIVGDLLLEKISSLNIEVGSWVNVVMEDEGFDDFSARELLSLESEFIHLRPLDEKTVAIRVESEEDGDIKPIDDMVFRGSAFNLVNEVVHNLFSNAVRHSGYDSRTKMSFVFRRKNEDLEVQCENELTKDAALKAVEKFAEAKKLAEETSIAGRRQDDGSGFAKIRTVAAEYPGGSVKITLRAPTGREATYLVSVLFKKIAGDLISDATYTDSRGR